LIPGLKGRECRVVNRNELPTHDTSVLNQKFMTLEVA